MRGPWRAVAGLTVVAALATGVAAGAAPAEARASRCHVPYLVLDPSKTYDRRQIHRARVRHLFHVHTVYRRLVPPVNWLQDPYHSQAFRSQLAALKWIEVLFYDYRTNGDLGALEQARNLIVDWIRHQPFGGGGTSDQAWQDKEMGDRAPLIAYLYRAGRCEGILSAAERHLLLRSIRLHGKLLTEPRFHPPSNHGLFVDAGLVLLGTQMRGLAPADHWRTLGKSRFRSTLLNRVFPREGMWLEPSAGYQFLVLQLLQHYLDIPGVGSRFLSHVEQHMRNVAGWLIEPDHHIVQTGDTDLDRGTRWASRLARRDRGMLWLHRSGLAVVHEPGSFLSTMASFYTYTHKHSDDLSFDLFDGGHRVVSDTGMYNKDPGPARNFVLSARAHSTLVVDHRGFSRDPSDEYGSGLRARGRGDGWFAIEGTNPLVRHQGVRHDRLFLYRPGYALIVADRVRAHSPHAYDRYFQLGPDMRIAKDHGGLRLRAHGFHGSLYSESSGHREGLHAVRGRTSPLAGQTSPSFRRWVPRWTVRYSSQGANVRYVTTFGLDRSRVRAHLGRVGRATRLRLTSHGHRAGVIRVRHLGARKLAVHFHR